MASAANGGRRKVAAPVTSGAPLPRPLLPSAQRAAQRCPVVVPLLDEVVCDDVAPQDHHVRLHEQYCVRVLRSIGWVFVAGTPSKAPELIRPRRLDHLGGC
jgi:hypothetical protein